MYLRLMFGDIFMLVKCAFNAFKLREPSWSNLQVKTAYLTDGLGRSK